MNSGFVVHNLSKALEEAGAKQGLVAKQHLLVPR